MTANAYENDRPEDPALILGIIRDLTAPCICTGRPRPPHGAPQPGCPWNDAIKRVTEASAAARAARRD